MVILFRLILFHAIDDHIFHYTVVNQRRIKGFFLVSNIDILEAEVHELVFVGTAHIKEILTIHPDIVKHDVVALRQRHILAILWLEELRPGTYDEERLA